MIIWLSSCNLLMCQITYIHFWTSNQTSMCGINHLIMFSCVFFFFFFCGCCHSVVSNSLRPCGLQYCRLPCPSLSPWVCLNSCPLSQWCHPAISSSVTLFSSFSQSYPASGSFPMGRPFVLRWPKYWSFSTSPPNKYLGLISSKIDWFDLLVVQGTLKSLLQCHISKASILQHSAFFMLKLSHLYTTTSKTIALTIGTCLYRDVFVF